MTFLKTMKHLRSILISRRPNLKNLSCNLNKAAAEIWLVPLKIIFNWNQFLADISRGSNSLNSDTEVCSIFYLVEFVNLNFNDPKSVNILNIEDLSLQCRKEISLLLSTTKERHTKTFCPVLEFGRKFLHARQPALSQLLI